MKVTITKDVNTGEVWAIVEDEKRRWIEVPLRNFSMFAHAPYEPGKPQPTGVSIDFVCEDVRYLNTEDENA